MLERKVVNISIFFTLSWYTFHSTKKKFYGVTHVMLNILIMLKILFYKFTQKIYQLAKSKRYEIFAYFAIVFDLTINHTFCGLMSYFLLRQIVN